ncbi:hypothetical protein GCM10010174_44130 [Kutzneria viridogrisea]|uniref:Uncharacterized protein n=2 Tax=Kutzneria TaxID=43356 RepID=W5W6T6_9PSEU|nr:hypothetical protein [Kutzneria albida]AHH96211.1 hypothetical protein KALB_2843 [Kutzneria albida DSM 43870]MBA8928576.1 hypothetical protein [Kutzneria viridogrisea]
MHQLTPRGVPCTTGSGTGATTTVVPGPRDGWVTLGLAGLPEFTVSLEPRAVGALIAALREADSIGVPCQHPVHPERLLGVNPHRWWEHDCTGRPPMELYLLLPNDLQVEVVFDSEAVKALAGTLAWAAAVSGHPGSRACTGPTRGDTVRRPGSRAP